MNNLELISIPTEEENAPHILFLHGAWHGAWCWEQYFLPYFAQKGYHAHALSLRCHGKSHVPTSVFRFGLNDYLEDLDYIIRSLPQEPILVGHSMGGFIVQKYLETHKVKQTVLMAPASNHGVRGTTWRIGRRHVGAFLRCHLALSLYPLVETVAQAKYYLFSDTHSANQAADYHSQLQDESYLMFLQMLGLRRLKPHLAKDQNILVLAGEKDRVFTAKEVQRTAKSLNAECLSFPGVCHDMMLDPHWLIIAKTMIEWLQKES